MSECAIGLLREWFFPFCHDFIFYGVFSLVIMAGFRSVDPIDGNWRIVYTCGAAWLWAWFLFALYSSMYRHPFTKYLITEHENIKNMRELYSLPPNIREPLTFQDMVGNVFRNQIVYFGLATLLWRYLELYDGPLEPGWQVLLNIAILMVSFDVLLYISHYVLHVFLWPYHRDHHRTKASTPASGWYMHIVDLMMELWIPIFVPAILFNMGWLTISTWLVLVEWDGVHTHAGFDFWPGVIPGPKRHWLHHMLYFCNYSMGLGDYLFGTEAPERERDVYIQVISEPSSPAMPIAPSFPFAPSLRALLSQVSVRSDIEDLMQFHAGLEDIGAMSVRNLQATFLLPSVMKEEPVMPGPRMQWMLANAGSTKSIPSFR